MNAWIENYKINSNIAKVKDLYLTYLWEPSAAIMKLYIFQLDGDWLSNNFPVYHVICSLPAASPAPQTAVSSDTKRHGIILCLLMICLTETAALQKTISGS